MAERKTVGVIGAGSFGTAVANLLAYNVDVLLYARNEKLIEQINETRQHKGVVLHERIKMVNSLELVANECELIFPVIPSNNFRDLMRTLAPYLKPYHFLIHGTKGLTAEGEEILSGKNIYTMSDVIAQESSVVRIGCLSGPNISKEILAGQPAATVIASRFKEVVDMGKSVLSSHLMQVYSTKDIRGAELAGAFKNIVAIGAGIVGGLNLGSNVWGLLITRGLNEMIHLGKALGADVKPFLGVAGIGDLVATASSRNSRNYTVGYHLAQEKSLEEIIEMMEETAEGIQTVRFAKKIADQYNLQVPITRMVYRILYEDYKAKDAFEFLIRIKYVSDVDYL